MCSTFLSLSFSHQHHDIAILESGSHPLKSTSYLCLFSRLMWVNSYFIWVINLQVSKLELFDTALWRYRPRIIHITTACQTHGWCNWSDINTGAWFYVCVYDSSNSLQLRRIEKGENATNNQVYTNPYATYISLVRRLRECDFL